jgi:hypothetical protein
MKFEGLIQAVVEIHTQTRTAAVKAVNGGLTIRNWLIGAYVEDYELRGEDRAVYGTELFARMAERLKAQGVPNCNKSRLYRYRDFYRLYPQIVATVPPQFQHQLSASGTGPDSKNVAAPSPLSGLLILERLSYSQIELLIEIGEPLKRAFYEVECIKGNWSVRELKRQIASLYFERSGLSRDKATLSELANATAVRAEPQHVIRDPYVSYYRANEMTAGDQPPVGILLCTDKNHALVEYALAGMDNRLFVSKYQLELPAPETLQKYLDEQRKPLEAHGA